MEAKILKFFINRLPFTQIRSIDQFRKNLRLEMKFLLRVFRNKREKLKKNEVIQNFYNNVKINVSDRERERERARECL
jgi:hypothetical protein